MRFPTQDLVGEKCADTNGSCKKRQKAYDASAKECIETIQTCRNRKDSYGKPQPLPYDEEVKMCGAPCTPPQVVSSRGRCVTPGGYDGGTEALPTF